MESLGEKARSGGSIANWWVDRIVVTPSLSNQMILYVIVYPSIRCYLRLPRLVGEQAS